MKPPLDEFLASGSEDIQAADQVIKQYLLYLYGYVGILLENRPHQMENEALEPESKF